MRKEASLPVISVGTEAPVTPTKNDSDEWEASVLRNENGTYKLKLCRKSPIKSDAPPTVETLSKEIDDTVREVNETIKIQSAAKRARKSKRKGKPCNVLEISVMLEDIGKTRGKLRSNNGVKEEEPVLTFEELAKDPVSAEMEISKEPKKILRRKQNPSMQKKTVGVKSVANVKSKTVKTEVKNPPARRSLRSAAVTVSPPKGKSAPKGTDKNAAAKRARKIQEKENSEEIVPETLKKAPRRLVNRKRPMKEEEEILPDLESLKSELNGVKEDFKMDVEEPVSLRRTGRRQPPKRVTTNGLAVKPKSPAVPRKRQKVNVKQEQVKEEITLEVIEVPPWHPTGKKFVGAHMSINGGLEKAILAAVEVKAEAFGMFLHSQRQWACKPLDDKSAAKFRQTLKDHNFPPHMILPHGSYLLNCGSPEDECLKKSRDLLIRDLKACEKLGIPLYNFHPGSTCGKISIEESVDRIAESINEAHAQTKYVCVLLENMSRQGHTLGGDFNELKAIIDRVQDKERVGVCLDTCHAMAAGYDLSKEEGFEKMMTDFETVIGLKYLKAMHLNDSKGEVSCRLDRHENIGKGHIGIEGFHRVMNSPLLCDIPMVLETPYVSDKTYADEIQLLNSLIAKT